MIKMNENMLKQIIIDTIKGEEHLGENIKRLCIDYIEQLQKQHADLNEHYNNMFECHCNRVQVEQLQNNWNELKKGIEDVLKTTSKKWERNCANEFDLGCLEIEMTMNNYGEILSKMQELENKNDK